MKIDYNNKDMMILSKFPYTLVFHNNNNSVTLRLFAAVLYHDTGGLKTNTIPLFPIPGVLLPKGVGISSPTRSWKP